MSVVKGFPASSNLRRLTKKVVEEAEKKKPHYLNWYNQLGSNNELEGLIYLNDYLIESSVKEPEDGRYDASNVTLIRGVIIKSKKENIAKDKPIILDTYCWIQIPPMAWDKLLTELEKAGLDSNEEDIFYTSFKCQVKGCKGYVWELTKEYKDEMMKHFPIADEEVNFLKQGMTRIEFVLHKGCD